jgi:GT2 family glycosyltransferase/glycosyltransferase involved in cell wall biosynthesis
MNCQSNLIIYNCYETAKTHIDEFASFNVIRYQANQVNTDLLSLIDKDVKNNLPIIFINAAVDLPPFALQRLLETLNNSKANICSALTCQQHYLSVLEHGDTFLGSTLELDKLVYALQEPSLFYTHQINDECFIIRDKGHLFSFAQEQLYACSNLLVQSNENQTRVKSLDKVDTGDQIPLPAHPLANLQWRIKSYLTNTVKADNYLLLDNKPIILHVAMSWGGGVHKWINDYCQHDDKYNHLILLSQGEFFRKQHGESLALFANNSNGVKIANFELQTPINAIAVKHSEYEEILKLITNKYQISQIIVSSLIGHSLECLKTDISTVRVFHDYFPSWPSLLARLDKAELLEQDLSTALELTENEPFGRISKEDYLNWKEKTHQAYQANGIKLIAPDQSVVDNLAKIDADLSSNINIIPHATDAFKAINYTKNDEGFTILVLGRINDSKGKKLLQEIIEQSDKSLFFILLGAGIEGQEFESIKNVSVVKNYDNRNLPQLLQQYQASIALITSQTSETFNYTLSELQLAGICAIATKYGALPNRIIDGETGFLCDNNAECFIQQIRLLKNNFDQVQKVRDNLLTLEPLTFDAIIEKYHAFFGQPKPTVYNIKQFIDYKLNQSAKQLAALNKEKQRIETLLANTEVSLDERTKWGKTLTKELSSANKSIKQERIEVERIKTILDTESKRMEKQLDQFKIQIQNINTQYETLNEEHQQKLLENNQLTEQKYRVESELSEVYNSRSWRMTEPVRNFTTWARHKRNAVQFRLTQLKSIPGRFSRSIKSRGVSGTTSIIKNKLSSKPKQEVTAQAVELTETYHKIIFNPAKKPHVSVIIPVYNQFKHTYNCIKSLKDLNDKTSFEIIVVDDCSSDDTPTLIKNISGITYQRQKQNGGFIESCNTGAKLAKGHYLMFLNNDTVVYDNWLDALLEVFENYPDAGLVGSKLVYPTNQLQEAGGIIFSDASGWNYGRMGKPDEPWYNHIREVDYCSGASILIENQLFVELGCFDERFKPAYYEDVDLAFMVRKIGKKTYYQPASKITHFEGISAGTDLTQGMKKYQVDNQVKFKDKWHKQLQTQPQPGSDIELCRINGQPKRILIFDACTPMPDQDAGSLRMLNIIKILKELGYHVVFMAENLSFDEKYTTALQQLSVECIYAPSITSPIDYLKDKGKYFSHVILSRYYIAEPVMPFIRDYCPKAKIIFDTVDLHYLREQRMADVTGDDNLLKLSEKTKLKEIAVINQCDTTLVVSPFEVEVLAEDASDAKVHVLSTIHHVTGCRKNYSQRKDIMFIGGYQHTPNVDAVEWFVAEIFPLILKHIPEIKFHIIGTNAPKHIMQMGSDSIIFHGFVEDIEPFMDKIRIAVAPLRYGAGVKGKINSSMSYGQPVVGTELAVEGMFTQEGTDVLTAKVAQEFAEQVIRLYQDEELWEKLSRGGLDNVQNYFSFQAAKKSIKELLSF